MVQSTLTLSEPVTVLLSAAAASGSFVQTMFHGDCVLKVYGTFDGATFTLQSRGSDGTTGVPVTGISLTSAGTVTVVVPHGDWIKGVISGAGAGTLISAEVRAA